MSYYILSESDLSCERTIIYQTVHENFIVIVQQKRSHEKEDWITHDHCMFPKIFINFMAQLPDKTETAGSGFITSGGVVPPTTLLHPLEQYDISNLPMGTKN